MYTGNENTFYASCAQRKIAAYFNLHKNLPSWKTWLATTGPILAAFNVDSSWDNAAANSGNIDAFHPDTVRGGHAVCIVGYRADGRFIVRNSWGRHGATTGFGYLTPTTSPPRSSTSPTASRCERISGTGLRPIAITDSPKGRSTSSSRARSACATDAKQATETTCVAADIALVLAALDDAHHCRRRNQEGVRASCADEVEACRAHHRAQLGRG